jgi:hypothetical protein
MLNNTYTIQRFGIMGRHDSLDDGLGANDLLIHGLWESRLGGYH